ncbi:caspase family protein [Bradyrhizobium oligotrophicum]
MVPFFLWMGAIETSASESPPVRVVTQLRHTKSISLVAFSPNDTLALSAGDDMKLWELATGREIGSFNGQAESVTAVAFSPDGALALSAGWKTLKLWDLATGREIRRFDGHTNAVIAVAFSSNGGLAMSASADNTLKLWDVATGREIKSFSSHVTSLNSATFSRDGRLALWGGCDALVHGRCVRSSLELIDVASGKVLRRFFGHINWSTNSVAFSRDGKLALWGGCDALDRDGLCTRGSLKLLDVGKGRVLKTFARQADEFHSVSLSPDGTLALSDSMALASDKTLRVWDVATGHEAKSFSGHGFTSALAFSSDGHLALSGNSDGMLQLWDLSLGRELRSLAGYSDQVHSVAFSPDRKLALSGSNGNTLKLWDVVSGRELRRFTGHTGSIESVAFSPDGKFALSGSTDRTLKLWDVATGRELKTFDRRTGGPLVWSLAFSEDGKLALSWCFWGTIQLWEVASGRELKSLVVPVTVTAVAFSPDGKLALLGDPFERTLKLLDLSSGHLLRTFAGSHEAISSVTFSTDGRQALSGSLNKTLKLWDVASGRELRTFSGHAESIIAVALSRDSKMALSGSADGTVKLWDVASGRELRRLNGHKAMVTSISFSFDGRQALSGSWDGTVRLWDLEPTITSREPGKRSELVAMLADDTGEWLVITPAGFFAASDQGADKLLAVVRGLTTYSVMQFYDQLYAPELVQERLTGDVTGRYQSAKARLDLEKILDSGPVPKIEHLELRTDAAGETIQVTVQLSHTIGKGIGRRLIWRLNGTPVGETEPPELRNAKDARGPIAISQGIKVDPDMDNIVTVTAYNGADLLATEPYLIKIDRFGLQSKETEPRSRMFIVEIGVNDYKAHQLKHLDFPVNDVRALAEAFKNVAEAGGYEKPVEIIDLTQERAVKDNISLAFANLAKQVRRQDALIVLLAGHGESVESRQGDIVVPRYFYYPSDAELGGEHTVETDGIGIETWARWIAEVQVSKKLIIVDTCKSWGAIGTVRAMDAERIVQQSLATRLQHAIGESVFTASRDAALEGHALGHGVLTYAVLEALAKPQPGNELLDVKAIDRLVEPEVKRLSQLLNREQQVYNKIGGYFPVGLPPSGLPPPPYEPVDVKPGKYVICSQIEVRSKASPEEGSPVEILNESGVGCTEVQVIEFLGSWTKIARHGVAKGYVPAKDVQRLN